MEGGYVPLSLYEEGQQELQRLHSALGFMESRLAQLEGLFQGAHGDSMEEWVGEQENGEGDQGPQQPPHPETVTPGSLMRERMQRMLDIAGETLSTPQGPRK